MINKKKKKGFTLIELMAVVAILAILAAVLVPTVQGYINRSKKAAVITQVRTAVNAISTYDLTAEEKISETMKDVTLTTLVGDTDVLGKDQLLTEDDITNLGTMTVDTAIAINKDKEAVNNVQVDKSTGKFSSYSKSSK